MNLLHGILLGTVEGLTEFLPISSTFHLIVTSRLLGLDNSDFLKLFEVVIQSGAILAIVYLYGQAILSNRQLLTRVVLSFIPTALVGLWLHDTIKQVFFDSTGLMLASFATVGVMFILLERTQLKLTKACESITPTQAILIGLAQSISVMPGVSRAGAVIVAMMLLGFKRDDSAKYSFYLSLPTILAASSLDLYTSRHLLIASHTNWAILGLATLVAFVTAALVVKWLVDYLSHHSLAVFGWYRLVLALLLYLLWT